MAVGGFIGCLQINLLRQFGLIIHGPRSMIPLLNVLKYRISAVIDELKAIIKWDLWDDLKTKYIVVDEERVVRQVLKNKEEDMKSLFSIRTIFIITVFLLFCFNIASAADYKYLQLKIRWIDGKHKSCYQICGELGYKPFSSGKYKNGEEFYICSANAYGQGFRPGYNLPPNWDNHCWVAIDDDEKNYEVFKCLCYKYEHKHLKK